jgi:hypothetical protein
VVVAIDPDTGQMRPPTAEEMQALAPPPAVGVAAMEYLTTADGSIALRVTDEQTTYLVARRNADGHVSIQHVTGATAARAQAESGGEPQTSRGKEHADER